MKAKTALLGLIVVSLTAQSQASAIYWDGVNGSWLNSAAWSTDPAAAIPDPAAAPVATDDVTFNISSANAATTVTFNANHLANSLTFNNTGTTTLAADGTNRALSVGAGGMTMAAGAGTVTIGSATAAQNIPVTFTGTQTWTNNSANQLILGNNFTTTGGITKQGTGDVWMSNTANNTTVAGLLNIQAGRLLVSGDFFMNGGLTGAGTLANGGPGSKWTFHQAAGDFTFSGTITGTAAARLGLTKRNNDGMLTLSGNNVLGDRLAVFRGGLKITGTTVAGVSATASGQVSVGANDGAANTSVNSTLLIDGGTLTAYKNSSPSLAISTTANTAGLLKMTSTGTITTASEFHIGRGNGSYAAYTQAGGSMTSGSWLAVGLAGDRGLLTQTGGSITVAANRMTIGAGGAASIGVVNLSGGTFTDNAGIYVGENGTGTLNISGTHSMTLGTGGTAQFCNNATSLAGTINLLGGTLACNSVTKGPSSATGVYRFNFNGGTLKANANTATFFNDLALTDAYVYAGGGTLNNNGFNITLAEALKAPTGNGVSATGLAVSGGSYLEAPLVTITGGGGTGATAVANIDASGSLTGITVTNPGIGYTSAPTFALLGGGFGNTGALTGIPTLVPNSTAGGMVYSGTGTTTLKAPFSYGGATTVNAGKLDLNATFTAPVGVITIANGAALAVTPTVKGNTVNATNVTLGSSGATTYFANVGDLSVPTLGNPTTAPLNVTGTLAVNGTVTINVTGTKFSVGTLKLITYAAKTGTGGFVLGTLPAGVVAELKDDGAGMVYLDITGVALPRWDGTVDAKWDTTTTNWVDQVLGTASLYADPNPVLFSDAAIGVGGTSVVLDVAVAPKEVIFNNTTKAYSLTSTVIGTGKITGTGTLIKRGTGTVTISGITNDYTGVTRLEGGTTSVDVLTNGGVAGPLGAASSAPSNLVLAGGTLAYTGASASVDRGLMIDGANSGINLTNNLAISGGITTGLAGGLVKTGAGILSIQSIGTNTLGAAGNGLFITAGKVVFDGTAGTQINNASGDLFVSHTPDVSADLSLVNTTLNVQAWLAIARGNGSLGVCNLSLANSSLNVGNFSCGYNNGLALNSSKTFITQSNSTFTSAGTTHLAENTDSQVTWELTNASTFTSGGTFNIGGGTVAAPNTLAVVTVKDTSSIIKSAGNTMVIGNSGIGTLNLENSALLSVPASETYIGNAGLITVGELNIKDTATANFGATVFVGKSDVAGTGTSKGTLNQTGGTVNAASWLVIGRYVGAQGFYNISAGTTNQTATVVGTGMNVGEAGSGVLTVSGSGVVNVQGNFLSLAKVSTGVGTVNLDGGMVAAKRVVEEAGGGSSTLNFNGGVLKALAASTDFVTVDTVNVLAGGAIIDSNSYDLVLAKELTGAGGLTKQGVGTLTLTNALSYAGATTVNGGTLALGSASTLPATTNLTVNAATLDLRNGSASRLVDVTDLSLNGSTLLVGLSGATTDTLNATGTVTASGSNTIKLFGSLANGSYNLISSVAPLPGTYVLDTSALAAAYTLYTGAVEGNKYVLTVAGAATPLEAYWLGDVSGVWNDATVAPNSNWATSAAGTTDTKQIPGTGTDVYFQATGAGITTTTLGADFTVDSLTFSTGTSTVEGTNVLTLEGGNANFKALEVQAGATATIGLTQLAYLGDTAVVAGATLNVTGGSLGSATTGAMQIDGVLNVDSIFAKGDLSGAGTVSRNVPGTGFLTIGGSLDSVFSGVIQDGAGKVRLGRSGTGKLTLTGVNTHTGGINLSGGILELGNAAAAGPGAIALAGGTLDNTTGAALNLTNEIALGGAWTFTGTHDLTLSGVKIASAPPTITVAAGTLTIPDSITGSYGLVKNGAGTLNLAGTVTSGVNNGAGVISMANGVTHFTGTLQSTGAEIWLGTGAGSNGTFNMTTGSIHAVNWLAIGRDSGNSIVNLSGGTVTKTTATGNITLGGVGGAQTATVNQSGGLITNTDSQTWIGEHGTGIYNVSGAATANLGVLNLGVVSVASASGTVNLNGGTLAVTQVVKGGELASATFNFNGGLLKANAGAIAATFLQGITMANVRSGGAVIDTNGQNLTINQPLQHSFLGGDPAIDGGLTKSGAGKLTIPVMNSYTGPTTVNAGILSLGIASLDDASTVTIATDATLDLTHTQTDIVAVLKIHGSTMPKGVYGAIGSGAQHENAAITGSGMIQVGVSQYNNWADLKGLVGDDRLPSADPDRDGMLNLLEYYLDGEPTAFTAPPVPSATATTVALTFSRRDDAEADMTGQFLQLSTSLSELGWTDVAIPAASGEVGGVTFTIDENGAGPDHITATAAKGGDSKKFLRLKIVE